MGDNQPISADNSIWPKLVDFRYWGYGMEAQPVLLHSLYFMRSSVEVEKLGLAYIRIAHSVTDVTQGWEEKHQIFLSIFHSCVAYLVTAHVSPQRGDLYNEI